MKLLENLAAKKKSVEPWVVFVAFDDQASRQRATAACNALTAKLWPGIEFELHWCAVEELGRPESAPAAAACATTAQIVIFASSACADLPRPVIQWLEQWSCSRHGREGTLIGLVETTANRPCCERLDHFLRNLAHRAGLDYLTHAPETGLMPMPDECAWITSKAEEVSSVLSCMLNQTHRPTV
jgi:hypothetical protein